MHYHEAIPWKQYRQGNCNYTSVWICPLSKRSPRQIVMTYFGECLQCAGVDARAHHRASRRAWHAWSRATFPSGTKALSSRKPWIIPSKRVAVTSLPAARSASA